MVDILRTGLSGLQAFQRALATTGHNIANVNTPNYSRQRVDLGTATPEPLTAGHIGTGVRTTGINRVYDDFLSQQVRNHGAGFSRAETQKGLIDQLGGLLGSADAGLSPALGDLFNAVQDLADDPASLPARQAMLGAGESLAARFRDLDRQLQDMGDNVNRGLGNVVTDINSLADAIAAVNQDITLARGKTGGAPNDLLDHRDKLLADLSQRVSVQAVAQSDGTFNVFIGNGQSLVAGQEAHHLETGPAAFDPRNLAIRFQGHPQGTDLSGHLSGGQLGGYLSFRQDVLEPARSSLGLLAMGLAETFNGQHRQGMDLNGQLGGEFFQAGTPRVLAHANNGGAATPSVTLEAANQLQRSDYELRYDGTDYIVRRLSDDTTVASGAAGPLSFDGLTLDTNGVPAAGDRFLIQPTREGAAGFALTVANPREIAAAAPLRTGANQDNLGSATISQGQVVEVTNPDLRRNVEIRFTDPGTFEVIDTATGNALAAGQPYTDGAPIAFNGWEVRIDGAPQTGDIFQVTDNTGGIGDNRNALALADLQSRATLLSGSSDYQGVYAQLVAEVGTEGSRADSTLQSRQVLLDQATQAREAVSGVNLDEEAAALMRFQQAYEASAQLIRVAHSLFETLLGAVRN